MGFAEQAMAEELAQTMVFTRCLIKEKLCLLLVDGGRETNLISTRIVSELGLPLQLHPAPYSLQLPYEKYSSIVVTQVAVKFTIGKYEDHVLCDVVYNLPSDIVLGQPWFHDRQVQRVSRRCKQFRLKLYNKVFILKPLAAGEALDDLKVLRRLQEVFQEALTSRNSLLRRELVKTQVGAGCLCSSPEKQSLHSADKFDVVKDESINGASTGVFLDGGGISNNESGASEIPESAQVDPLTPTT
ncbi:unnamed protein product [Linum trigynum]|uniref:Polyprotein n=1 Tax=Linum trigynum TaxID=586398 RepID=A0AAV2E4B2_9ROSI